MKFREKRRRRGALRARRPRSTASAQRTATVTVGYAWYTPEGYERLIQVCDDRAELDDTYEGWLANTKRGVAIMDAQGLTSTPITIDVEALVAWCAAEGRANDSTARAAFIAHVMRESEFPTESAE